ncbi:DUF4915 domain-containing protein [Nostoc sp.]|uniref:DUF4915 domain-containing protein n=1 Tax=Nostoc sp. TaxID=1180 RepID=UPI002FF9AD21
MLATFPTTAPEENNLIQCDADRGFISWLSQAGGSVAITTYQAGKLALVGWNGQQITMLLRQFSKPMGLAVNGSRLALATHHEVCLLANAPALAYEFLEDQPGRYDALYLPRMTYFTGDLNIHDLEFGREGLWVVNTRFSCLSALRVATLLKKQKGKCTHCGMYFREEDVLEIDHITPKSMEGKDEYKNLQILHRHCHDEKTTEDGSVVKYT